MTMPQWLSNHINLLTPMQRNFVMSDGKMASYVAGNGMGKTHAGLIRCLRLAYEHPGVTILVCDATTEDCARLLFEKARYYVPQDEAAHANVPKLELELANGSRLLFRHLLYGRMLNNYTRDLSCDAVYLDNNEYMSYRDFLTLFLNTRRYQRIMLPSPIFYTGEVEWRHWRDLLPKDAIPVPLLEAGRYDDSDFVTVDEDA